MREIKSIMAILLLILFVVLVTAGTVTADQKEYNKGFKEGCRDGFRDGYKANNTQAQLLHSFYILSQLKNGSKVVKENYGGGYEEGYTYCNYDACNARIKENIERSFKYFSA